MNKKTGNLLRIGAPMLIGVIVLVILIASVGANGTDSGDTSDGPPGGERQVERVKIEQLDVRIAESFPVQVFVDVRGYVPDPCWEPQEPVVDEQGPRFEIEIVAERAADEMCAQVIENYETTIGLGSMDPGNYVVAVNGIEQEFEVQ